MKREKCKKCGTERNIETAPDCPVCDKCKGCGGIERCECGKTYNEPYSGFDAVA